MKEPCKRCGEHECPIYKWNQRKWRGPKPSLDSCLLGHSGQGKDERDSRSFDGADVHTDGRPTQNRGRHRFMFF